MEWIGHYEFGANFKPIDFNGWLDEDGLPATVDRAFWLKYWNAAYTYALQRKTDNVLFIDFDRLLGNGARSLQAIAEALAINDASSLLAAGGRLRSPTTKPVELQAGLQQEWERAQQIHNQLQSLAV